MAFYLGDKEVTAGMVKQMETVSLTLKSNNAYKLTITRS